MTLSDAAIGVIRQAFLDWKVLFFLDQDITTEQHLAFGRRFGELEVHPFAPEKPGFPEVLAITHDEDSVGGDTLFAEFDATCPNPEPPTIRFAASSSAGPGVKSARSAIVSCLPNAFEPRVKTR